MEIDLKVKDVGILTCIGKDKCTTCRLGPNGSHFCPGCNGHCGYGGESRMDYCRGECSKCGGGDANPNTAPAICCKSPLADLYLDKVEKPNGYRWTKRSPIELDQQGIIVTQGSFGRIKDPYPKETKALAVNIRHIWSGHGWFSKDMKDYLKIPRGAKLILLTMTHDDVLERAWDNEVFDEDFERIGFDYWQPLTFSTYYDDAKMNQYWLWKRTLYALERSKGWWGAQTPWMLTRKADDLTNESLKAVPQVMFNVQFLENDEAFRSYMKTWLRMHNSAPSNVSFWFVGMTKPKYIRAVKSFFKTRRCYFLATSPWLAGHKGCAYTVDGRSEKSDLPKDELVVENQRAFMKLAQTS